MALEMNCPVCGHTCGSNFCEQCGFEIHILPTKVPSDVQAYEAERISRHKAMMDAQKRQQEKHAQDLAAMEQRVKESMEKAAAGGYLVLGQYKNDDLSGEGLKYQILDVFPIHEGVNVFGRRPRRSENSHAESILFPCAELKNEHFAMELSHGTVTARLLDGSWNVRNRTNNVKSEVLQDRDEIFIGNMIFTFIQTDE